MGFIEILLFLFMTCEFYYHVRVVLYLAYFILTKSKERKFDDEAVLYGICSTTDLDFMLHMNNARYLREVDFAIYEFYVRSGLHGTVRRAGGALMRSATTIRYRKPVTLFQVFRIRTKLRYWDERNAYLEHRIETIHDNFIRAIALTKLTAAKVTLESAMKKEYGYVPEAPIPTPDLARWIESNELSSKRLQEETAESKNNRSSVTVACVNRDVDDDTLDNLSSKQAVHKQNCLYDSSMVEDSLKID